ncbi:hypothetical protein VIGAN_08156100 [Vigna angularis var. angularis]|uniref:Uncharacterized protein n=1 Tax=Vigna angularis var. angularis TaxID=157739 RepID=A0A0S3SPX5_PHAAN|nr:hypothetical protein VIGAN_08156100 [Vigna angularis var. angularis]
MKRPYRLYSLNIISTHPAGCVKQRARHACSFKLRSKSLKLRSIQSQGYCSFFILFHAIHGSTKVEKQQVSKNNCQEA